MNVPQWQMFTKIPAVKFFIVEFYDTQDEFWATNAVCSILTLNSRNQVGSAEVPYDYELDGTDADFTIAFADVVNKILSA